MGLCSTYIISKTWRNRSSFLREIKEPSMPFPIEMTSLSNVFQMCRNKGFGAERKSHSLHLFNTHLCWAWCLALSFRNSKRNHPCPQCLMRYAHEGTETHLQLMLASWTIEWKEIRRRSRATCKRVLLPVRVVPHSPRK